MNAQPPRRGTQAGASAGGATRAGAPRADARRAEALGALLPPLLVAAERVAATVAQGVHGRRRAGQGDSFWQFRPFVAGDTVARIDWRQSARSDRAFVRETEWEAAQTVCLWRDGSAGMQWRSGLATTTKLERADLLLLALAALVLRAGERVRLIGPPGTGGAARAAAGRAGLERLAELLAAATPATDHPLPPDGPLPRHGRVVLIGDLLSPLHEVQATVARLAAVPVVAHLVQVLDPAEVALPYSGRVRFVWNGGPAAGPEAAAAGARGAGQATLIPRVEGVRDEYAARLAAHQAGLAAICAAAGFGFMVHHTDHSAEAALLALYTALAPAAGRR